MLPLICATFPSWRKGEGIYCVTPLPRRRSYPSYPLNYELPPSPNLGKVAPGKILLYQIYNQNKFFTKERKKRSAVQDSPTSTLHQAFIGILATRKDFSIRFFLTLGRLNVHQMRFHQK